MRVAREWPPKTPQPLRPPDWRPPGLPEPDAPSRLPMVMPPASVFDSDLTSRLLRRRIVLLTGRLDAAAAYDVVATLLLLDEDAHRPIRLHLSTNDVELEAGSLVADTVDILGSPVHAVALGAVGGAGLGVLTSATERSAHPQALFILREPHQTGALGAGDVDATRAAQIADQQQRLVARLHERIAGATGRPVEQVAADMRAGRVLSAAEAIAYGLVRQLADRSGTDGLN
jgi:ATP-dependent Clp protease, protease subunit